MDIGFIGLGNMGYPMARRLVEAGHKLIVYDTSGTDDVAPDRDRRGRGEIGARRRRPGRDRDGEPADARHRARGRDRQGRRDRRQEGQALPRPLDHRRAHGDARRRGAAGEEHHRHRPAGERRGRRRREGHARRDVCGPARRLRRAEAGAVGDRQAVLHRRQARHGPDHEAVQQPALGGRDGALLRGDGDGHQGRARSGHHGRRDQCGLGRQHRGARQVSARGDARHLRLRLLHRPHVQGRAALRRRRRVARRADAGRRRGAPDVAARQCRARAGLGLHRDHQDHRTLGRGRGAQRRSEVTLSASGRSTRGQWGG